MKRLNLPPTWIHRHYETVDSTMLRCDPSELDPGEFLLVTADEQTAGRGQRGTTWESTKGLNLTFNIGWKAPVAPLLLPLSSPQSGGLRGAGGELACADRSHWPMANEQFLISEITALAVLYTIEDTLSEATCSSHYGEGWEVAIKWPNDIYFGDRKICGMLLEHSLSGRHIEASIAGIGINVNQASFDTLAGRAEGRGAPISLRQIAGHEVSREAVLESFVHHFMEGIALLQAGCYDEVEHAFTTRLYRRTGWRLYRDAEGEFLGEFAGIARNGLLTLRKQNDSLHSYAFKEVSYVI